MLITFDLDNAFDRERIAALINTQNIYDSLGDDAVIDEVPAQAPVEQPTAQLEFPFPVAGLMRITPEERRAIINETIENDEAAANMGAPAPAPAAKPDPATATRALVTRKGIGAAHTLLAEFGVKRVGELPEDRYAEYCAAAERF